MRNLKWIIGLAALGALLMSPVSTRVQRYANDLGWTKLSNGPALFQFTTAQFPGYTAFSAVACVATPTSVYVGIGNSISGYSSAIVQLDASTLNVLATVPMPTGAWLNDIALSPGKLWAGDWATGNVYRMDLATNTVDLTITTGFTGSARAVVYGNGVVMVADQAAGSVHFYNAATGAVAAPPITVGALPLYGDFDGTNFWIVSQNNNQVVKIDGTALTAIATISTLWPSDPTGSINPFTAFSDGAILYVVTSGGYFTLIDIQTNAVIDRYRLEVGSGGHFLAKVRNEIWVAQHSNNKIGIVNAGSGDYLGKIPVGTDPAGLCFNGYDIFNIDYLDWTLRRHSAEHRNS